MTLKDKLIFILLSILTLGIFPLVIYLKKNQQPKAELSAAKKSTINIKKLVDFLGSPKNIEGAIYSYTKVKIYITDHSKIDLQNIKTMKGISGVFSTSKSVTIIVGNQAKVVAQEIIAHNEI